MDATSDMQAAAAAGPVSSASLERLQRNASARPKIAAVILFGSAARGETHADSDLDIGVLLARGADMAGIGIPQMASGLMEVFERSDVDMTILDRATPLLMHRAVRDGHVLYATSNRAVAELHLYAIQQYEDTRVLREMRRQAVLQGAGPTGRTGATTARLDQEVVVSRLADLQEAVTALGAHGGLSREELEASTETRWALLHGLQACLKALVWVSRHLLGALETPLAHNGRTAPLAGGQEAPILALVDLGVLSAPLARSLASKAAYGQELACEPHGSGLGLASSLIDESRADFRAFAQHVAAYLANRTA